MTVRNHPQPNGSPGSRGGYRVALVTQGFTSAGGVRSVAQWLRGALTSAGHDVDVHDLATSSRDGWSRRARSPATWLHRSLRGSADLPTRSQPWGANVVELEPLRYARRRELTAALRDYDLIQVVAGGPALGCAVIGAGPPVFLQVASRVRWERVARRGELSRPARLWSDAMTAVVSRLEIRALAGAAGVLVENAEMLQVARDSGQRNVRLAPPGVDTARFRPARGGWRSDGYLLSVCRFAEPRKRPDRLLRSYRVLLQVQPDAPDLLLAGRGTPSGSLRRLIDELGLADRVVIRSEVPAEELPELYRGAAVYLQTSQEEGLGISVLEAMASGLPVVATDTAGARVCIDVGGTGLLISQDEEHLIPAQIAAATQQVLTASGATLAENARRRALEEFSTGPTLRRFTAMYEGWFDAAADPPATGGAGMDTWSAGSRRP